MKTYFLITTSHNSEPRYDLVQTEATPEQTKAHLEGLGEGRTVRVLTLEQIAARHELAEAAIQIEIANDAVARFQTNGEKISDLTFRAHEAKERFRAALKKVQDAA